MKIVNGFDRCSIRKGKSFFCRHSTRRIWNDKGDYKGLNAGSPPGMVQISSNNLQNLSNPEVIAYMMRVLKGQIQYQIGRI